MGGCGFGCDYPGVKISIEQGCFKVTHPKDLTCPGNPGDWSPTFLSPSFWIKHRFLSSKTSAMYE